VLYPAVNPAMALTTHMVVDSVPPEKAGAASGLSTTANDLGLSLGVALIGSIAIAIYRNTINLPPDLPHNTATAARDSLDGAVATAPELPTHLATAVLDTARTAFTTGLNITAITAAIIAAAGAILAATHLKHIPPTGKAETKAASSSEVD
jgi:MFS transporter, DHA2 family, multidrug resistance protein